MTTSAFTIVTKNYIGLAEVLGDSIKEFNPEIEFYIFIADRFDINQIINPKYKYIECFGSLEIPNWNEMAFKYNLVEFCTALKPFCFEFLNSINASESAIYFDPDILVFSPLNDLLDNLKNYSLVVTPHICSCVVDYTGAIPENEFLNAGIYNLGFIALRFTNKTNNLISWWKNRLTEKCFISYNEGLFTDQVWMNFITCFFERDEYFIERGLGYNLAPWNYFEREIKMIGDDILVRNRLTHSEPVPLVFVHFSGYDYKNIDTTSSRYFSKSDFFDDLSIIFQSYSSKLVSSAILKYFDLQYDYGKFSNGRLITYAVRRIYRRLVSENEHLSFDPFDANSIFFKKLNENKLLTQQKLDSNSLKYDNVKNSFDGKIIMINRCVMLLNRIIGFDRLSLLIKFFSKYFRYENFIFLYDKKFLNRSFKKDYFS